MADHCPYCGRAGDHWCSTGTHVTVRSFPFWAAVRDNPEATRALTFDQIRETFASLVKDGLFDASDPRAHEESE